MKNHPILDVNATLHSGDIILFSGETLFSHTIRNFTNSRWSHCGMAIFDKRFGANVQIWDVSKKTFGGIVDLYDLQGRIAAYQGAICYRPLYHLDTDNKTKRRGLNRQDVDAFSHIYDHLVGRPYETSKIELFNAAFDVTVFDIALARNDPDLTSIFCGELVAETYQRLGLLGDETPSNEYVPADFGGRRDLRLMRGYHFGPEIPIKETIT